VQRFDTQVKDTTPVDVYDSYIEIVLANYHRQTTTQEFKRQLADLLAGYPHLMDQLPIFFSEIDDEPPSIVHQHNPAQGGPPTDAGTSKIAPKVAEKATKASKGVHEAAADVLMAPPSDKEISEQLSHINQAPMQSASLEPKKGGTAK